MTLQDTLGNFQWLVDHYTQVRNVFPAERISIGQQDLVRIGFALKVAGVEWRTEDELTRAMVVCHRLGMFSQELANGRVWIQRSRLTRPPDDFFHTTPQQREVQKLLRSEPTAQARELAGQLLERVMSR